MKKSRKIPKFKSSARERDFWQAHDSTDYIDWSQAKLSYFPNLKPSTRTISLRLPDSLLNDIKILANKEAVPYQSLIKMLLAQGVRALKK
jgi:predicted DNA binding CopG/RHH family protein